MCAIGIRWILHWELRASLSRVEHARNVSLCHPVSSLSTTLERSLRTVSASLPALRGVDKLCMFSYTVQVLCIRKSVHVTLEPECDPSPNSAARYGVT